MGLQNKNYFIIICILLSFLSCKRSDNVIKPTKELPVVSEPIQYIEVPIVITKTDTLKVYVQPDPRIEDLFINTLKERLGTKEKTGNNDGEAVEAILASCGINIPAPWCACFLHDGLIRMGLEGGPKVNPGLSSNWFRDPNKITWVRDRDSKKMTFQKGWVGGIYFRSKGRIAHIFAIIEDTHDGYVITIEGNTDSQGSREGNGVFIRIRNKSEIYMTADWLTKDLK